MERPSLVNLPDFFVIGIFSVLFLMMIGVLADAYMVYRANRATKPKTSNS